MPIIDLQLPNDIRIQSVQELERTDVPLAQLLDDVSAEQFAQTVTARDARFVNLQTHNLRMSSHSLVVRTSQGNVMIDTCVGNEKSRPQIPPWHMQSWPYLERLGQLELTPADIDYVCCTHLHADHVGWNTRLDNGVWVPTFPNARYMFAEPELRYWEQTYREKPEHVFAESWNDSVLPVIEAGQADVVAADHEVVRGVCLQPAFGHSPGNVVVSVSAGGQRAMLSGDVMHHPVQIERPHWNSIYDQDRERAQATREQLLQTVADGRTYLIGAHFAGPTALRVTAAGDRFSYK
ncbi:MAG: MBL fold metallo-hydrolase [Alphaproteobacteria bacterium]